MKGGFDYKRLMAALVRNEGSKMMGETNLKGCVLMSIFLLTLVCTAASARIIYVDDDGPADFNTIQAAIDDSNDGDTIIVADGTYTGDGNRDIEFSHGLPEGQTRAITVRSANGPHNCIIDCNGSENDRHRGFYFHSGEDANSVINGFTITGGYAGCDFTIPPLGFCFYVGGAFFCHFSSPTVSNCIISGNTAGDHGYGGGIACYRSNPTVSTCTFSGNSAFQGGGMGIFTGSDPTIINCTFSGNSAVSGGGIYNGHLMVQWENNPKLANCILWGNSPEEIYVYDSTPVITYSNVESGWSGEGNIDVDPCFIKPGHWEDPCNTPTFPWDDIWIEGDYHLKSQAGRWTSASSVEPDANEGRWTKDEVTSPCIDAGNPNSPIGLETFPNGGRINMGAYGGTIQASKSYFGEPVCEKIVAGDINGDCEVNFKDFALMSLHWLQER